MKAMPDTMPIIDWMRLSCTARARPFMRLPSAKAARNMPPMVRSTLCPSLSVT
jgi:hypothetical protein